MTTATAEQSQAYIDQHYVTRSELARLAGVPEDRIVELADAKCIPPHAYEVRSEPVFVSSFGEYRLPAVSRFFYHPRMVDWIKAATRLAETRSLSAVAKFVKQEFESNIDHALAGRPSPWPDGKGLVWDYLMDGTWSLCLKEFNVPDLVQKEVARATIAKITGACADRDLTGEESAELQEAIENYDAVALPFSPHEVRESSRCLEVGAVMRKYGLTFQPVCSAAD